MLGFVLSLPLAAAISCIILISYQHVWSSIRHFRTTRNAPPTKVVIELQTSRIVLGGLLLCPDPLLHESILYDLIFFCIIYKVYRIVYGVRYSSRYAIRSGYYIVSINPDVCRKRNLPPLINFSIRANIVPLEFIFFNYHHTRCSALLMQHIFLLRVSGKHSVSQAFCIGVNRLNLHLRLRILAHRYHDLCPPQPNKVLYRISIPLHHSASLSIYRGGLHSCSSTFITPVAANVPVLLMRFAGPVC